MEIELEKAAEVRLARLDDLPELERLKLAAGYPGSRFLDEKSYFQQGIDLLRYCLPKLPDLPEWRVLVLVEQGRPSGFMVLLVDQEHGVTHQLQTLFIDHVVSSFDGLSLLLGRARKIVTAWRNQYLVVNLPVTDKRAQLWFYRCGFRAEENRVVKRIERGHQGASSPLYRARRARAEDLPFIMETHSAHAAGYRPACRDTNLEELEFRYQMTYLGMNLDDPSCNSYRVLEEVSSGLPAGYILLKEGPKFGQAKSLYIYDVAISPQFSGRGLSLYLMGAAESLVGQEGGLLYGDGSLEIKSLANWHAQVGLLVDSVRFALDCRAKSDS